MDDAPLPAGLPPSLRFLKWLVIVLTLTMIGGVITVVWLLVTRMPDGRTVAVPTAITLPEGATVTAYTQGPDWFAVVTADGRILIFRPDGTLRQEVQLAP